jgi:hypothetical protein
MTVDWTAIGAIATAVSVAFLAWQLMQANVLQRKKVEEEYLRAALSKSHAPCNALVALAQALHTIEEEGTPDSAAVTFARAEYRECILEYGTALNSAVLVAETTQRVRSSAEYDNLLSHFATMAKAIPAARTLADRLLQGELGRDDLMQSADFRTLMANCDAAAEAIIAKLLRLYDILPADSRAT